MNIPQANDFDKVIEVFTYISMHPGCHLLDVSDYIGFTDRQGRYYFHACQYLGLVDSDHRLTPIGQAIWQSGSMTITEKIYERIIIDEVMGQVFAHGLIFPEDNLLEFTRTVVIAHSPEIGNADSTFERRCKVVVKWVERVINYVKLKNK